MEFNFVIEEGKSWIEAPSWGGGDDDGSELRFN
jgi:hypothetical protein